MKKILATIVAILALIGIGAVAAILIPRIISERNAEESAQEVIEYMANNGSVLEETDDNAVHRIVTAAELQKKVQSASSLISWQYEYTDLGERFEEESVFFGKKTKTKEHVYIKYSGCIQVGVKLDKVSFDINEDARTITVHLPAPEILGHDNYDEMTEVILVKEDKKADVNDYFQYVSELREGKALAVMSNEHNIDDIKSSTTKAITELLTASGLVDGYTLEFEYAE